MRIGTKLFAAVGFLILLFSVVQGGIPVSMTSSALKANTVERLEANAGALASMLQDVLHRTAADLQVATAHKALENYLTLRVFEETEGMEEELNSLEAFLVRVMKAKPEYTRFQVSVGERAVLQINDGARTQLYDTFPAAATLATLKQTKSVAHQIVDDDGQLVLLSAAPVGADGRVEAILWAYQPIVARVQGALDSVARLGLSAVVTEAGDQLVAHTGAEAFAKTLAARNPEAWIVRRSTVPELDWGIAVALSEADGFAVVRQLKWTAVGITVISLAVMFATLGALVSRLITRRVGGVTGQMRRIAQGEGDLTVRLKVDGKDEIADLSVAFNAFVAKVREAVARVAETTPRLAAASRNLAELTTQANQSIERQTANIDQVATAMEQMTATIHEVSDTANRTARYTQQADERAGAGLRLVERTLEAIGVLAADVEKASDVVQKLATSSNEIGGVLDVIRGIAEQTNLLALNAAIEAARAGDQGRGFAVVADEVRTLAQRTHKSTYEIQGMIERLQVGATEAVAVLDAERGEADTSVDEAGKTGSVLQEITSAVGQVNDMNTQIASSAEEQTAVAEDINRNVVTVNEMATEVVEAARKMAESANELAGLAGELEGVVGQFKV